MKTAIHAVRARRIWDSRGRPTIEVEVSLADGAMGRGVAPAGASRGSGEAHELRDGGRRFGGLDVMRAIGGVADEIEPFLEGKNAADQRAIDLGLIALDGDPLKRRLGGNALVATSLAVAQAYAAHQRAPLWRSLAKDGRVSLPCPEIQIFGGGAHAFGRIDVQDMMVIPVGAQSYAEALSMCAETYRAAGQLMAERGRLLGVADEGGWWPAFESNEVGLQTLVLAIERAGFAPGKDVAIALDVAATQLRREGRYTLPLDGVTLDSGEMCDLLSSWCDRYPIVSIEDPLAEDDEAGLRTFTARNGSRLQIVGDDHLVTDSARIRAAAALGSVNAALIKINQAGTLTEAADALSAAKTLGLDTIVSARSGETEDVAIAHLAVGWDAGQLKVGSFARSERTAKWNEALRIEAELGENAYRPWRSKSSYLNI